MSMRYEIEPIGRVISSVVNRSQAPRQGEQAITLAWLVFDPAVADGIRDIAAGSEVIVLTWLHQARRDVLVVRYGKDPLQEPRGVFSSRSPDRPNPIGLHRVQVVKVDGLRILVRGLEAIDGTPVIDVKPARDPAER